jgi:hypothetical protein
MVIDWQTMREDWIEAVQEEVLPKLPSDTRFNDGAKLTRGFELEVDTWKKTDGFRPVIEIGNELAAAECLLNLLKEGDSLIYEPPMAGTKKRIDFLRLSVSGQHEWVEVKKGCPAVGRR